VDALLDAKPSRAEPSFAALRLWTSALGRPESEYHVVSTIVVLLGAVMIACLIAVAVIPRFDRRALLTLRQAEAASGRRVSASRSA